MQIAARIGPFTDRAEYEFHRFACRYLDLRARYLACRLGPRVFAIRLAPAWRRPVVYCRSAGVTRAIDAAVDLWVEPVSAAHTEKYVDSISHRSRLVGHPQRYLAAHGRQSGRKD